MRKCFPYSLTIFPSCTSMDDHFLCSACYWGVFSSFSSDEHFCSTCTFFAVSLPTLGKYDCFPCFLLRGYKSGGNCWRWCCCLTPALHHSNRGANGAKQGFDSRSRAQCAGKYQQPKIRKWQQLMVPPYDVLHVISSWMCFLYLAKTKVLGLQQPLQWSLGLSPSKVCALCAHWYWLIFSQPVG